MIVSIINHSHAQIIYNIHVQIIEMMSVICAFVFYRVPRLLRLVLLVFGR